MPLPFPSLLLVATCVSSIVFLILDGFQCHLFHLLCKMPMKFNLKPLYFKGEKYYLLSYTIISEEL